MGKPEEFPEGADYYCPYQIKGYGREKVMVVGGIDPFQAIQLALSSIGVELAAIRKESGGELVWDAGEKGDLGFGSAERG